MNPTLPDRFAFDLTLARLGWPLVTRDGRKAEVLKWDARGEYPMVGFRSTNDRDMATSWTVDGQWQALVSEGGYNLFLSADLTNPAVQKAVEAAHKAGEAISWIHIPDNARIYNSSMCGPTWNWKGCRYFPTRLLSQLPKPESAWKLPEPPKGAQWHRVDGWTADMLPEGMRPLLASEMDGGRHSDIEFKCENNTGGFKSGTWTATALRCDWFRTRRPLPPEHHIAEGHNPDRLSVAEVGVGWRLLDKGDTTNAKTDNARYKGDDIWMDFACDEWKVGRDQVAYRRRIAAPAGPLREQIVAIAKLWPGHGGVNWETTTDTDLLSLIKDAVEGDRAAL